MTEIIDKNKAWDYAFGLIQIDGLKPTPEFLELVELEKAGMITTDDITRIVTSSLRL